MRIPSPPLLLLLLLLLLCCALHSSSSSATTRHHSRRILHQPFFPQDSFPPSQSPTQSPPPPPEIPFSNSTPFQNPFFPTDPSPPPPPPPQPTSSAPANISSAPANISSAPANISSLSLPKSPTSKPINKKLIATAIAVVLAAAAVISAIILLHIRNKRNQNQNFHQKPATPTPSNASKNPNHKPPPPRKSPQTSSEFLYLGTLVNSHTAIPPNSHQVPPPSSNGSHSRKMESPDLQPLPPLRLSGQQPQQHHHQIYNNNVDFSDRFTTDGEEKAQFYSPKGSVGNGSRRTFYDVPKHFEDERADIGSSTTSSSSSYTPSAGSDSPARSVSLSISPPASMSPKAFAMAKSPDLVAMHTSPGKDLSKSLDSSPRISNASSSSLDRISLSPARMNLSAPPPVIHFTATSSPASSLPDRNLSRSGDSSPTLSDASSYRISQSSAKISNAVPPVSVAPPPPPPPPPPLPPTTHWEIPRTPSPKIVQQALKPPLLSAPSRPVTLKTQELISPVELPHTQESVETNEETPKLKLKPLHWDKVRASSDREMVWDQLRSSSFKLNEEMIETLFVVNKPISTPKETTRHAVLPSPTQENRVLDPKKSQNLAILLRALNVTIDEVCEALSEGNADNLGTELLESLLKMAPTKEEERKLMEYKDDSPFKLGPAEKFLKAMLGIPFAFKRVDAMLYISNFDSEVEYLRKSFETLEAACEELRTSRMFLKLLEAVLKTGNRMNVGTNRGDAQAFKLDTLLKLVDVKGADGKTTLLHFVVQEIIRSEGARLTNFNQNLQPTATEDAKCRKLGLQVVSSISSELSNVKKAAAMDSEVLNGDVLKLSRGIGNIAEVVRMTESMGPEDKTRGFSGSMNKFMKMGEEEIIRIQAQESVALSLVKEITEYFHGNSAKEEAHPFRIFLVVRDFLTTLDRVCKEVGMINERTIVSSAHRFPVPVNPTMPPGFSGFPERRQDSSSGDESLSP